VQPVFQNSSGSSTLYSPDVVAGDIISLQLGPIDAEPTAGTFNIGVLAGTILSVATSGAYPIQTEAVNLLATSNLVYISGSLTTPSIDGYYVITRIDSTHFDCAGIPAVSASAAGGNIYLVNGTSASLQGLVYNASATAVQAVINPVLTQLGFETATVSQPGNNIGVYQFTGTSNGMIPTGCFWADITNLYPSSQWAVFYNSLGSSIAPYVATLLLEQAPFCYAQFTTALPSTGVTFATAQIGSGTADQIQTATFNQPNTYGGTYTISLSAPVVAGIASVVAGSGVAVVTTVEAHHLTTGDSINIIGTASSPSIDGYAQTVTVTGPTTFTVSVSIITPAGTAGYLWAVSRTYTATCGQASPGMSIGQLATVLSNHPSVNYNSPYGYPNNIILTLNGNQSWQAEFTGTLGNSSLPVLSSPSNSLIGPEGFSGVLNYNTTNLFTYSLTQSGNSFDVPFTISRTRTSGEQRTLLYLDTYTIWKDNLNYLTASPVGLPGFVQVNTSTYGLIFPTAAQFFGAANGNVSEWMQGLPTSLPVTPNTPWLNGRMLALS
jgi:hypothetical protein